MKALKIIGGIIAVVVAAYLIMCAMGPSKFEGTSTLEMEASPEVAYGVVSDMTTWGNWIPWKEDDPSMVLTMGEKTKGMGASYSWTSDKMGGGSSEVVEAKLGKSMKNKLAFEGFDGDSYGVWKFEKTGENKTAVTWGMESENDVPFWMRGMMLMGPSMEETFTRGLNNMKPIVEKAQAEMPKTYRGFTVNEITIDKQHYIGHREKIAMADMQPFFAKYFPTLAGGVAQAGSEMVGMPKAIYYEWDEENKMTELAAAIQVKESMEMKGYSPIEIPAGKALHIDYYGSYEGSPEAHYAMDDYMKEKGLESSLVIEEYVTDPTTEPDASKWLTKIVYVLK